jgi:hypothetical protein
MRRESGRRLGREARALRSEGAEVVLIQPTSHDLAVMGANLMSRSRRHEVIENAIETVGEQLRAHDIAARLAGLLPGEPHKLRRPDGPPSSWPPIVPGTQPAVR